MYKHFLEYTKSHKLIPGLLLGIFLPVLANAADPVRLRERFEIGDQHHVQTRVEISGQLTLPAEKDGKAAQSLKISGNSSIDYDERILSTNRDGRVDKTIRVFRRMSFTRTVRGAKQELSLRKPVQRVVLMRRDETEVPFSPDGPLTWGEIDLIRTDVFVPALRELLPGVAVRVGDRWKAGIGALRELTDMKEIKDGGVVCHLDRMLNLQGRNVARVAFSGTVEGTSEDGPSRQKLDGFFYFDLDAACLSYLSLRGRHSLLDENGKEMGHVEGRFVLSRGKQSTEDLSDRRLRGEKLVPDRESTRLLYDNETLKLQFLYPRNWHVSSAQGAQVTLETAAGNGLILTIDAPRKGPSTRDFYRQSKELLEKGRVNVRRITGPDYLQRSPTSVERFTMEAEGNRQRFVMDYFVIRASGGDATLAARLLPGDLKQAQEDVVGIARSLRIR